MRVLLAGELAELLFARKHCRGGSSLDELGTAKERNLPAKAAG